jgi:glutamate N-acetyltransferase/amino-acid N-acetyltransferase
MSVAEGFEVVAGYRASGVYCGLRDTGEPDLALIASDVPCVAAAVFTRNRVQAAPVLFDRALLSRGGQQVQAVVINAANANACTGDRGLRDAEATARLVRQALALPHEDSVFVMSTGVIGKRLDMGAVTAGVRKAARTLRSDGWRDAARAIMTTDTRPKMAFVRYRAPTAAAEVTVAGIAKGAGMIHPDMATMLAVIATDAAVASRPLQHALRQANRVSFNCISVDGDTSTNDTVVLLANGAGDAPLIAEPLGGEYAAFTDAVTQVCQSLARQIAWDGEGATKRITIRVTGAPDFEAARRVGRVIASSPLVKTAIYGHDANWGRVIAAAGRAGVAFDPHRLALSMAHPGGRPLTVVRNGQADEVDDARAQQIVAQKDIVLHLDLAAGTAEATVWTCDLSHDYVSINAEYRT